MSADTLIATNRLAARSSHQVLTTIEDAARASKVSFRERQVQAFGRACWALPKAAWIAFDVLVTGLGLYLGFYLVDWLLVQHHPPTHIALPLAWLVVATAMTISGLVFGWYELETFLHRSRILSRSLLTAALTIAIAYVTIQVFMYTDFSRQVGLTFIITFLGISVPVRGIAYAAMKHFKRGLLVIGTEDSARWVLDAMKNPLMRSHHLVGFVRPGEGGPENQRWFGYRVWPSIGDIARVCLENDVREVVVDKSSDSDPAIVEAALSCLRIGCRVTNQSTFIEKAFGQIPVEHITPDWFLFADLEIHHSEKVTIKRVFDIAMASIGLVLTVPLWPIIALIVKLNGEGPVFFSQLRVGQNGSVFRLYKFRTMRCDQQGEQTTWTADNDPRVTRAGRWLRRIHLDELPQLWNILCGQMSLVGPRPEQTEFVRQLTEEIPYYNERHLVKPGLTGWAQINFGYANSIEDARRKLQLDLYYIKHMSLELDITILFRTLGKLFYR